jgi:hypothetical protein
MNKFVDKQKIKRFFSFGCSFTRYAWTTWSDIIAEELKVPYYNYGGAGAGNQYIFNTIMQADAFYKFNENDLIMVSWTNVCREDRYIKDKWQCPGNIYSQNLYSKEWVDQFADTTGMAMRDFAAIHAVNTILKSKQCQYYFLSMIDITKFFNQYQINDENLKNETTSTLISIYNNSLSTIISNFYDVLWNGEINNKINKNKKKFNCRFNDPHPSPIEHYEYLKESLKYEFNETTIKKVQEAEDTWERLLIKWAYNTKDSIKPPLKEIYSLTQIAFEYEVNPQGWILYR